MRIRMVVAYALLIAVALVVGLLLTVFDRDPAQAQGTTTELHLDGYSYDFDRCEICSRQTKREVSPSRGAIFGGAYTLPNYVPNYWPDYPDLPETRELNTGFNGTVWVCPDCQARYGKWYSSALDSVKSRILGQAKAESAVLKDRIAQEEKAAAIQKQKKIIEDAQKELEYILDPSKRPKPARMFLQCDTAVITGGRTFIITGSLNDSVAKSLSVDTVGVAEGKNGKENR